MKYTEKEIKAAVIDCLKARIYQENYGMLSHYHTNMRSYRILEETDTDYDFNKRIVTIAGKPAYKIIVKYAARKVNGMYKMLTPKLEAIA